MSEKTDSIWCSCNEYRSFNSICIRIDESELVRTCVCVCGGGGGWGG